jgi:hypothetical protein
VFEFVLEPPVVLDLQELVLILHLGEEGYEDHDEDQERLLRD